MGISGLEENTGDRSGTLLGNICHPPWHRVMLDEKTWILMILMSKSDSQELNSEEMLGLY